MAHCKCKGGGVKDALGNCIIINEPWHDKELFTIGNVKITTGTLTALSIGLIVLGAVVFLIMSILAWYKRKSIASGARRASDYVRRAS